MKLSLVCFVEGVESDSSFVQFTQEFEKQGYENFVLFDIVKNGIRPEHILLLLEHALGDKLGSSRLVFVSNIRNFALAAHRLFHQTFERFIYFSYADPAPDYLLEEPLYQELLGAKPVSSESLDKPMYYTSGGVMEPAATCLWTTLDEAVPLAEAATAPAPIQKFYYYKGSYHLFEPSEGAPAVISLTSGLTAGTPADHRVVYHYPELIPEQVERIFNEVHRKPEIFLSRYDAYEDTLGIFSSYLKEAAFYQKRFIVSRLERMAESGNTPHNIYILSYLLAVQPKATYRDRILQLTLSESRMARNQKFFVLYQSIRHGFVKNGLWSKETNYLQRSLYRQIYQDYKSELIPEQSFIPKEQRNSEFIMVISGQVLNLNHAPTKTALDRCYTLIRSMNKKVLLINTKEVMSIKEVYPFHSITGGNVNRDYSTVSHIDYKDIQVPFYQPDRDMPDADEIRNILDLVLKYKPYCILNIGGTNLTADLCSNLVPVITISTVYGSLPMTEGQFPVIGRKAAESDFAALREFGMNPDNLIESVFTFDFKPQTSTLSRKQLGLPEDKKLLAVIGYRLNHEVTDDFLETLVSTLDSGAHIVFVGGTSYSEWCVKYPELRNNSTDLGFQEDVLAVMDLVDIYVNPRRSGGGSSAVEALYKGVPVVTLPYGDVSASVGEEFRAASLDEMRGQILRYVEDAEYYSRMSGKAKEMAEILMNTDRELERIIRKAENSPDF